MKAGDLIMCDNEFGIVLSTSISGVGFGDLWLECFWSSGDFEGIKLSDVEVINEI